MTDEEGRSQPDEQDGGDSRVSLEDVDLAAQYLAARSTKEATDADSSSVGDLAEDHLARETDVDWPDPRGEQESLREDQRREDLEGQRQDREQRKEFATRIYRLVVLWLLGVFLLLVVQGMGRIGWSPFHLADSVVIAAIGGTTVNVIAIFIVVARYLFPDHGSRTWRTDSKH